MRMNGKQKTVLYTSLIIIALMIVIVYLSFFLRKTSPLKKDDGVLDSLQTDTTPDIYQRIKETKQFIKRAQREDSLEVDSAKQKLAELNEAFFFQKSSKRNIQFKIEKMEDSRPMEMTFKIISSRKNKIILTEDNFLALSKLRKRLKPNEIWRDTLSFNDTLEATFKFDIHKKNLKSVLFLIPDLDLKLKKDYQ